MQDNRFSERVGRTTYGVMPLLTWLRRAGFVVMVLAFVFSEALSAAEGQKLTAHFFYIPGCPSCEPTKQAVAAAQKKFTGRVEFVWHSLTRAELTPEQNQKNYNSFILALSHYGRKDTPSLVVFAGRDCLGGGEEIIPRLEPMLEKLLREGAQTPDFAQFGISSKAELDRLNRERASPWLVMCAGLADGFNPCAFATVILFVSMLSGVGRSRRMILAVGLSFILGVFLTYTAIGAAFFQMMKYFETVPALKYVGLGIKWFSLALVLVAGVLSLVDAVRAFRSGGKAKMLLVLPEKLKDRIRKRLRVTAHGGSLIVGSFLSGIVISFLEAACTGQTYLPVITGLVSDPDAAERGYALLLLYNILFILPLLAVFLAVFFGMTSDQIGNMMRRRVWVTKLALAAIFLAMGIWLAGVLLPTLQPTAEPVSGAVPAAEPERIPAAGAKEAPAHAGDSAPFKPVDPAKPAAGREAGVDR